MVFTRGALAARRDGLGELVKGAERLENRVASILQVGAIAGALCVCAAAGRWRQQSTPAAHDTLRLPVFAPRPPNPIPLASLQRVERELDEADHKIGEKLHVLDLDGDGMVRVGGWGA